LFLEQPDHESAGAGAGAGAGDDTTLSLGLDRVVMDRVDPPGLDG
jgi:hypothetical protein